MYEKFYGFKEKPFNLTPDSKFFYASPKHEEALNTLLLAISERNGFVVVTGEIGSGKTTVCRTLLNRLDPSTKVALILNTHLNKKELLTAILDDLDIEYKTKSKSHLLGALNKYLIEQAHNDVNVVLIIDEAQNLTPSVIEEVRMLSNLETEKEKLIQIVLIGQPELRKKLSNPNLEQFRQRVVFHYHLQPLDYIETGEYIKHRLAKAGNKRGDIFSQPAIEEIYKYSKGVPRLINLACHNALISGLVYESKTIYRAIAEEAIIELTDGIGHVFHADKKKQIQKLEQAEEAAPKQFMLSDTKFLSYLNGDEEKEKNQIIKTDQWEENNG
ncbi:MAG: AAA family ATPase [Candidatus Omnitrophica bacterium]|nr:AAA family ATPase [Candidatus Omnitrophota bacterium]